MVHTSVEFGERHVDMTPAEVQPILMRHVTELFPDWPAPASVKCQKWRYSQVGGGGAGGGSGEGGGPATGNNPLRALSG